MSKLSNSAMLLDIETFIKQEIAEKIMTCPSRIKILSIGCIDQQWSEQVDEFGFSTNEEVTRAPPLSTFRVISITTPTSNKEQRYGKDCSS